MWTKCSKRHLPCSIRMLLLALMVPKELVKDTQAPIRRREMQMIVKVTYKIRSKNSTNSKTCKFTSGCRGLPDVKQMKPKKRQRTRKAITITTSGMTSTWQIAEFTLIELPLLPSLNQRLILATQRLTTLRKNMPPTFAFTSREVRAQRVSTVAIITVFHSAKTLQELQRTTWEMSLVDQDMRRTKTICLE